MFFLLLCMEFGSTGNGVLLRFSGSCRWSSTRAMLRDWESVDGLASIRGEFRPSLCKSKNFPHVSLFELFWNRKFRWIFCAVLFSFGSSSTWFLNIPIGCFFLLILLRIVHSVFALSAWSFVRFFLGGAVLGSSLRPLQKSKCFVFELLPLYQNRRFCCSISPGAYKCIDILRQMKNYCIPEGEHGWLLDIKDGIVGNLLYSELNGEGQISSDRRMQRNVDSWTVHSLQSLIEWGQLLF